MTHAQEYAAKTVTDALCQNASNPTNLRWIVEAAFNAGAQKALVRFDQLVADVVVRDAPHPDPSDEHGATL